MGTILFKAHFGIQFIAADTKIPPSAPSSLRELLSGMLRLNVSQRITAKRALQLSYCTSNMIDDLRQSRNLTLQTPEQRLFAFKDFISRLPRRHGELLVHVERGSVIYGVITSLENAGMTITITIVAITISITYRYRRFTRFALKA